MTITGKMELSADNVDNSTNAEERSRVGSLGAAFAF